MRAYLLALVIGVMSLGALSLTPTGANAHEWRNGDDTVAVRWRGGSHYRGWYGGSHYRGWYGGSHYYAPYYGGGYYSYPAYNVYPSYDYYYSPGYNYYSPGYNYYYTPRYRPRVSVYWGW